MPARRDVAAAGDEAAGHAEVEVVLALANRRGGAGMLRARVSSMLGAVGVGLLPPPSSPRLTEQLRELILAAQEPDDCTGLATLPDNVQS